MMKVFLDANVYFSAARSPLGGSSLIIAFARKGILRIFASPEVLREAERNLRLKEPQEVLLRHYQNLQAIDVAKIRIDKEKALRNFGEAINPKDALILEGVRKARADYLVTLDRRHFFTRKVEELKLPFEIVTPGRIIEIVV